MNDFRAWLSEELTRRGWSHSELGRRAGVSQVAISNVLSGNRNPGATLLTKLAQALGESPESLLRLAGLLPPPAAAPEDPKIREVIELMQRLSPEDREEILNYARFKYQQKKR